MSNTSDEINLQSKQNIICHVAKVKSATSTHYHADLISFFSVRNIPFESNASIKPEKCISHALKTKQSPEHLPSRFLSASSPC